MDFETEIKGHTLEFYDAEHIYLVDGVIVPSITQIMKVKFGQKYKNVPAAVLNRAAEAGTKVHEAIERYCVDGAESDLPELDGFKELQEQYGFEVLENETPVILFFGGEPVAAGRLDLVLKDRSGKIGGADIKRTSVLDTDYLTYQLNLYRIAYNQCYNIGWEFIRGIHLRLETRKYVPIDIDEGKAISLVEQYLEVNK